MGQGDPVSFQNMWRNLKRTLLALLAVIAILVLWQATFKIDNPVDAVTLSNTFTTDPGWHSKWAQNQARFGQTASDFDFNFMPAAPFHNFVQAGVFSIIGPSFAAQRLYGITLLTCILFVFYRLARYRLPHLYATCATAALALNINILGYTRAAYIEPLGILMALLACFFYCSDLRTKWRIVFSVFFSFLALFTKAHFVAVVATFGGLWAFEILIKSSKNGRAFSQYHLFWLLGSFGICLSALAGFIWLNFDAYQAFQTTVARSILGSPGNEGLLRFLYSNEMAMLRELPAKTDAIFGVAALIIAASTIAARLWLGPAVAPVMSTAKFDLYRLEISMLVWLGTTLLLVGVQSYQPTRYFLPAIVPLTFFIVLAADIVKSALIEARTPLAVASRAASLLLLLLVGGHIATQIPAYASWLGRDNLHSQYKALDSLGRRISTETRERPAVVIGLQSSMLSLVDPTIRALEPRFLTGIYTICDRLAHWRPQFATAMHDEAAQLKRSSAECGTNLYLEVLDRYYSYDARENELTLIRIHYQ